MRLVNKSELARHLGVSIVTIGNWLARFEGFPVHSKGTNGREYQFDLAAVVEFLEARQEEERRSTAERDTALAQLVLPLVSTGSQPEPTSGLSIKDQIEALKLSTARRREMEQLGQLVNAEEIAALLSQAFANLNRAWRNAARSIGHDFNLPPQIARSFEMKMADAQRTFVRELSDLLSGDAVDDEPLAANG